MNPIRPKVEIVGDRADGIMAKTGWIAGYLENLTIWRFGFLPETPQAKAYSVKVDLQLWVLADQAGEILLSCSGNRIVDLPPIFQKIINSQKYMMDLKKYLSIGNEDITINL